MMPGRGAMPASCGRWRLNALRRATRAAVLVGVVTFSSPLLADPPTDKGAYNLAPGDKITVTVFGQPELSGDLLVDGAGIIMLPFVGGLEIKGLTVLECQKLIHDRLADGILTQPSVSVRVSELRPLYILGDVRTPGTYAFRYSSTVKSAVAAAGGFGVAEPAQNAALSEFLLADERVRQLSVQKQALLVRSARLEAQRDGMKTFNPPPPSDLTEKNNMAELVAAEKETFDSQGAMLQTQLDLLRSQKPRIQNEIAAVNAQIAASTKQRELISAHSDEYSRMVKQGLGLSTVELQFKLSEMSQENELFRLTALVANLQIDAGEIDLKIDEAESSFRRQTMADLRDLQDRLRELDVTLPSAREIREARLEQAGGLGAVEAARSFSVTRTRNGEASAFEATEMTPLEPGDIVEVKKMPPRELLPRGAAALQGGPPANQLGAATQASPVVVAPP